MWAQTPSVALLTASEVAHGSGMTLDAFVARSHRRRAGNR
jgi:hypothetical protein